MHRLRQATTVVLTGLCAGWVARAILDWILGVEGTVLQVGVIVAIVFGAAAGLIEARDLERYEAGERRDAIVGWTFVIGLGGTLAALTAPMPWGALAAAAIAAATLLLIRRASATSASRAASRSAARPR